jgi:ectoine hydroxylase-related dioxygenase (phytanoyl-CoA dioxygenase family)
MERGSAFFYTGKVFHGAGANHSDTVRQGINLTYAVGWVRQEENQFLSTPIEVARNLDDDLLKLMGYQLGGIAMGYIRDFEDPLVAVRDLPKEAYDFAAQAKAAAGRSEATPGSFYEDLLEADRAVVEPAMNES